MSDELVDDGVELLLVVLPGCEEPDDCDGVEPPLIELLLDGVEMLVSSELLVLEGDEVLLLDGDGVLVSSALLLDGDELLEALPPWTPSAASVCWSSCPDVPSCLDCWNCCSAACVFGPICPSIGPGLKPWSFSACCACFTLLSPCEDDIEALLEDESFDADELPYDGGLEVLDEDFVDELSLASTAPEESANAAMTAWESFILNPFLWGGHAAASCTCDLRLRRS